MRYTWKEFEKDYLTLVVEIGEYCLKNKRYFKNIYGVPRGGLVLAVVMSHYLDIPLILNKDDISENTLVVDDISDSGMTLQKLDTSGGLMTVTLFVSEDSEFIPDFWLHKSKSHDWIVFPWENPINEHKRDNTI